MAAAGDDEIQAIQAIIDALDPLDPEARDRVLDYAYKRLGIASAESPKTATSNPPPPATTEPLTAGPKPQVQADIRSLRSEKSPRSANEMAAIVAYYLSELAPPDERTETVTTADIEKYFKQAGHELPQVPSSTLKNAAAAGYFDSASRGAYRLNPVGYNLVAHSLPRSGAQGSGTTTSRRRKPSGASRGKAKSGGRKASGSRKKGGGGRKRSARAAKS